jgi:epoxyqueuosine reductase
MVPAPDLPLKRLAARSGLAAYGRNNVCYVDGMGSHLSFAAYYSDVPCDDERWMELRPAARCARCKVCLNDCPTGAIRESRFLIDNQRCLSYLNESSGDFPGWLPASVHHCVYDCLRCQLRCPMNKEVAGNVTGPIEFDREETEMLLAGAPVGSLPPALQRKARHLGIDEWPPDAIARNLKTLFERDGGSG